MYRYSEMSLILRQIRLQSEESGQMELTALLGDSPASPSASPASGKAQKTSGSCGDNLAASLKKLDQVGLSLKTYLESSVSRLTTYLPTWKAEATDASRLYIRLRLSVRRTEESGSSLWPTVTSRDWKDGSARSCRNVPVNCLLGRAVHWVKPGLRQTVPTGEVRKVSNKD